MSIDLLASLRAFDTPTVCNALEIVDPGRRAAGFTARPFVCAFPSLAPIVGHARTATIRSRERPTAAPDAVRGAAPWLLRLRRSPAGPTIAVIEDLDPEPGFGAFWGEVNTTVHKGLGVLGCITNGSIRDLDMIAGLPADRRQRGAQPRLGACRSDRSGRDGARHAGPPRRSDPRRPPWRGAVLPADKLAELLLAVDLVTRREAPILTAARQADFGIGKLREAMAEADEIH